MELRNDKEKRAIVREKNADAKELLPGIDDDITLAHITTKLAWRDIHILASVSRAWRRAIQSRQVYDARVRLGVTESFILIYHNFFQGIDDISLCSMKDNCCHKLPPIASKFAPRVMRSKLVTLDGRVYLVGHDFRPYVLDLAGQRQWKQCSSRGAKRFDDLVSFECGIMDEKIYAFGSGWFTFEGARSQVYDLERQTCSFIKEIPSVRDTYQVAVVGDELLVHGGYFVMSENGAPKSAHQNLDFYNPVKDAWRVVENLRGPVEQLFEAGGRLYSMSSVCIHVYDVHGNSWAPQHLFSFSAITRLDVEPINICAVGDELFAILYLKRSEVSFLNRYCLVRSTGFNSQNKELLWELAEFVGYSPGNFHSFNMCSIEL